MTAFIDTSSSGWEGICQGSAVGDTSTSSDATCSDDTDLNTLRKHELSDTSTFNLRGL